MEHVVLVPGFWHGTWCWSPVTRELAARRIPTVAVDVQGQGLRAASPDTRWRRPFSETAFASAASPVASVTATSAAHDLLDQLRLVGGGDPCVVVAHSMGGVVATLAAELEPSLFSHLVYLAAFAPVDGSAAGAHVESPDNAEELGTSLLRADPYTTGASRLDTGDEDAREAIRAALYGDVTRELADAAIELLNTDAPVGIAVEPITATRERFGSIPHTYVLCRNDCMIRPALQTRTIQNIDRISTGTTSVVEIDASHSPFLSRPAAVAEAIASAWDVQPSDEPVDSTIPAQAP